MEGLGLAAYLPSCPSLRPVDPRPGGQSVRSFLGRNCVPAGAARSGPQQLQSALLLSASGAYFSAVVFVSFSVLFLFPLPFGLSSSPQLTWANIY